MIFDGPAGVWRIAIRLLLFEARYGLALLPNGKRKNRLRSLFEALVAEDLDGRVLVFDQAAAEEAAQLAAERHNMGLNVDMRDTFIAGIALARKATLATRNIRHFDDLHIKVVNPWSPL